MIDCGLSLGGYSSLALAHAYCDESLARPDSFLVLIASEQQQVVGFVVVLRDGWSFWRGFLGRHPLLALKMGLFSLKAHVKSLDTIPSQWHSHTPTCLRVMMIAVSPGNRRQGLGRDLYEGLFALSPGRDLWALVSPDNGPSVALHRGTGWAVGGGAELLLATRAHSAGKL